MVKVSPNAGGVCHHMGDIVLLMDTVKQVCHWALGKDRHIFPTVGLMAQGNSGLGLVVVVSCRSEISFECLPEPQCCNRNIPFFLITPSPKTGLKVLFTGEEAGTRQPGEGISPDTSASPRRPHSQPLTEDSSHKAHVVPPQARHQARLTRPMASSRVKSPEGKSLSMETLNHVSKVRVT